MFFDRKQGTFGKGISSPGFGQDMASTISETHFLFTLGSTTLGNSDFKNDGNLRVETH